jgi:signal peptidase II
MKRSLKYILLGGGIVLVDGITKMWAIEQCQSSCLINPFLAITPTLNRGISWGLLYCQHQFPFILMSLFIVAITIALCAHAVVRAREGYAVWGHVWAIAGSVSNIYDRFMYGGVIDFILIFYKEWEFPVFNIADVAIVGGVALMFWQLWFLDEK